MRLFHSRRDIGQAATASSVTRFDRAMYSSWRSRTARGKCGIVEQDVVLVVELETTAVHVRRADQGDLAIQRQRFGVQQATHVLVDLDPRGEQVRVVTAAGRSDEPRVVPGGKDDRRVHSPVSGRAQRIVQGLVGHVVGGGGDDLAPRREHQGFEHFGHGRKAHRRARADHLRGHPSRNGQGQRLAQELVEVLIHVRHPVAREQELVLACDGALEAHHGVHPWCVLRLHKKLWIGTILAAAVRDPIVDNHDLAMVAEIDPTLERPQQRVADGKARRHTYACRAHRPPMLGADDRTRTEIIGHHTAGNAAPAARFKASTTFVPLWSGSQM